MKHTAKIAKLANLLLSKKEIRKFTLQLTQILKYIEKLNEVDTKSVESTNQVTELENVFREDTATPSLPQDEVLKNSKSTRNGLFKIKAILDS